MLGLPLSNKHSDSGAAIVRKLSLYSTGTLSTVSFGSIKSGNCSVIAVKQTSLKFAYKLTFSI